jgi:anti-anti-sigma factor
MAIQIPTEADNYGNHERLKSVQEGLRHVGITKILFLSADPSDSGRLRLGQELRDIREKLNLSRARELFELHSRESLRPEDITQAIFDIEPQVLHFSGHGTESGHLCFEDSLGKAYLIETDVLSGLFELISDTITCVVLNACFSEIQAKAIVSFIPFVIGMNDAIGDNAAIAFSIGFYRALVAGQPVEKAYRFGCIEMRLKNINEHMKPVLIQRDTSKKIDEPLQNVQWMLVLSGTIDDCNRSKAEAIVSHLQILMDDPSITLMQLKEGSIKLFLEGSQDTFEAIQYLFEEGLLQEVFEFPIQDIALSTFDEEYLERFLENVPFEKEQKEAALSVSQSSFSIFQVSGSLNASNAQNFQKYLLEMIKSDAVSGVFVDMSGLESLDSVGLISLVNGLKAARELNKRLCLTSVPPAIGVVFQLTQLDRAFEMVDSTNLGQINYGKVA